MKEKKNLLHFREAKIRAFSELSNIFRENFYWLQSTDHVTVTLRPLVK
jgi:hypothetical protein